MLSAGDLGKQAGDEKSVVLQVGSEDSRIFACSDEILPSSLKVWDLMPGLL